MDANVRGQDDNDDAAMLLWLEEFGHTYVATDTLDLETSPLFRWVQQEQAAAVARAERSLTRLGSEGLIENKGEAAFGDELSVDIGYQLTDAGRARVQRIKQSN